MSKKLVLLVDDEINVLNSFRRVLRGHVSLDLANSGQEALSKIKQHKYAVIVTDMQMPEMNGLQLLKLVKEHSPDTVRMMFTGNADQKTAVDAVNFGDVFRFINKPCTPQNLIGYIDSAMRQYDLIVAEKVLLNNTLKGVVSVLNEVLSLMSSEINEHNSRIQYHMYQLASAIKLKKNWSFEPMVQLSQLGYIIFPESTLKSMSEGKLVTEEAKQLFAQHPCLASDLIRKIPRMGTIANSILYQEKCYDGRGFPYDDKQGDDIPLGARMLKIVCAYTRLERAGIDVDEAIQALENEDGTYDPKLLEAFKTTLTIVNPRVFVDVQKLTQNMVLEEEILTNRGQLVAGRGQRVTEALLNIIRHCLENNALNGLVEVSLIDVVEENESAD